MDPGTRVVTGAVAAAAAVILLHAAGLLLGLGSDGATAFFSDAVATLVALAAGVACAWTARRSAGSARFGWGSLAAGCGSWAIGSAIWTYYEFALAVEVPFPSLADVGFLGFVPLAGVGVLILCRARSRRAEVARVALDAAAAGISLLLISWVFVLHPIVAAGGDGLALAVSLAYPLGDVVILGLTGLLIMAARDHIERRVAWSLATGLAAFALADSAFAYLTLQGAYATGGLVDVGWTLGFAVVAVAAVDRAEARPGPRNVAASWLRPMFPVPHVLVASAVVLYTEIYDNLGTVGTSMAFALALVIAGRQWLTIADNNLLRAEVESAYGKLQAADASRRQMVDNIAHDIANPLTPIAVQLHLLERAPTDAALVARATAIIRRNVAQIDRLVRDFREVRHLDSGRVTLHPARVDLRKIVTEVTDAERGVATGTGVVVETDAAAPVEAVVDEIRMAQVVGNLVKNAVRFSPSGTKVVVAVRTEGDHAVITVSDHGLGIAAEDLPRLFRPFVQVHDPSLVREKGSGLGLFIAKGIVDLHGGDIRADSEGKGHGATFTVRLPRAGPPTAPAGPAPVSATAGSAA